MEGVDLKRRDELERIGSPAWRSTVIVCFAWLSLGSPSDSGRFHQLNSTYSRPPSAQQFHFLILCLS